MNYELNADNRIDKTDVKLLREYNYYDGVTEGIVEFQSKEYYLMMVDEYDDTRIHGLFEMTDKEIVFYSAMDDYWSFLQNLDLSWDDFKEKFYTKYPPDSFPPPPTGDRLKFWFSGW